jgi:hypothetical protein
LERRAVHPPTSEVNGFQLEMNFDPDDLAEDVELPA